MTRDNKRRKKPVGSSSSPAFSLCKCADRASDLHVICENPSGKFVYLFYKYLAFCPAIFVFGSITRTGATVPARILKCKDMRNPARAGATGPARTGTTVPARSAIDLAIRHLCYICGRLTEESAIRQRRIPFS